MCSNEKTDVPGSSGSAQTLPPVWPPQASSSGLHTHAPAVYFPPEQFLEHSKHEKKKKN